MKRTAAILTITFLTVVSALGQEDQQRPITAQQPSTVTVYGAAEQVSVTESQQPAKLSRKSKGIKGKFGRIVGGGSSRLAGWMISADEVIPAPREKASFRQQ